MLGRALAILIEASRRRPNSACNRPFPEVGSGVNEIRINCADGWFRVMYVAKFEEAIYVLHSFQKKSGQTSKGYVEIARTRYRAVARERKAPNDDRYEIAPPHQGRWERIS